MAGQCTRPEGRYLLAEHVCLMSDKLAGKVIRDPLWNTIRLDPIAAQIVDTPEFQRLRYIRQLGFTHLVYPGATHTRFDHALGVYYLTTIALARIREDQRIPPEALEAQPTATRRVFSDNLLCRSSKSSV